MDKKLIKRIVATVMACASISALSFAGCIKPSDKTPSDEPGVENVAVESVSLNIPSASLKVGQSVILLANVLPEGASNKSVSWSTSDDSVATVANGYVVAVGVGSATITATTADGGLKATCSVTVTEEAQPQPEKPVITGVTVKSLNGLTTVKAGEQLELTANVAGEGNFSAAVAWTIKAGATATDTQLTEGGLIIAGKVAGKLTAVATSLEDNTKYGELEITVTAATTPVDPEVKVTSVTISGANEVTVGQNITLTAEVLPANATNKTVTWVSSDPTKATVNANGVITGVAAGEVTITATADGVNSVPYNVTVKAATTPVDPEGYTANGTYTLDVAGGVDKGLFTSEKANATSDSGYQGGKYFKVASGDYLYINMKLQKNKVITVSGKAVTSNKTTAGKYSVLGLSLKTGSTGVVTGLPSEHRFTQEAGEEAFTFDYTVTAEGTVVIQLTRNSGSTGCEITELNITVADMGPVAVKGISINKTTSAVKVGATETLTATVSPANADNTDVIWSSSDESVATVDQNGLVTALKAGTAVITATAAGDTSKTASCTYTVTNVEVTGISFANAGTKIAIGDEIILTPIFTPANATVKTVSWQSSDPSKVTVDQNGKVTGVAVGTATITATSTENSGIKATYIVEVLAEIVKVSGISLSDTTGTVNTEIEEKTIQLTAFFNPENATNKNVSWSSSDERVASVDSNGLVTAHKKSGTAVITVTAEDGGYTATYTLTVEGPAITANTPIITKASDNEFETAYVEWTVQETQNIWFNVYYQADNASTWTKLDAPLVRQYKDYYRADMVGLKAGTYKMKVVPVVDNAEVAGVEAIENNISVRAHERTGYAFADNKAPGAYNLDGTLKEGAKVVYVTAATAKTVTCTVLDKGKPIESTGFQTILDDRQGSGDTTPICFRLVGTITKDDLDHITSSKEGLQIKETSNITIEGIGNDATIWGFGMLLRSVTESEVRNLGILNFMDDGISIDTDNKYLWIHNNDFFYGGPGGDTDQAKGDGSLDTKGSSHMTHAYNHFWDSGKCNLQGMKSEDASYRMTYHHNWYDHSDSRHPRIRTATVHVYNNYFDGNAKYGVGVTMGASAFVEANYFRSTAPMRPMMSSKQGTDAQGDGTFSGENGGIIKAFANVYDTTGGGTLNLRTYQQYGQDSDCYEVTSREETVPSSVTTVAGGTTYNNFDTASDFYSYTVETAEQAKATVMEYAGRLEGGDLKWDFDDAVEDSNYAIISGLKAAIVGYKSSVVKIGG